jgi:hypothetical protein
MDSLRDHVSSLKTENERLAAPSRPQRDIEGRHREARSLARRSRDPRQREAAKTMAAIQAFESLAQWLEAIAAARRPWWRRLVG